MSYAAAPSLSVPRSSSEELLAGPPHSSRKNELHYAIRHHQRALQALQRAPGTLSEDVRRVVTRKLQRDLDGLQQALGTLLTDQ